jgi:cytochrome c553
MAQIAGHLSDADISAVAAWLSAQDVPDDTRPAPATTARMPLSCGSIGE